MTGLVVEAELQGFIEVRNWFADAELNGAVAGCVGDCRRVQAAAVDGKVRRQCSIRYTAPLSDRTTLVRS